MVIPWGRRTLHLAASHRDYTDALRLGEEPGAAKGSHWLLGMRGPGPDLELPPHMEWIRLPHRHAGSLENLPARRAWVRDLASLVETFAPDTLVFHRGFCRLWGSRLEEIVERLPNGTRVVYASDGTQENTREAS